MRKINFFLTACAMMVAGGAWAQTDVTSQYIQNADFSKGTPITVGVCTYEKDMANNNTQYSQLVPVEGWEFGVENGDARAGGLVAFGSGVWIGGPGYTAPVTNSDGDAEGNILGLVGVWTGTAQYVQTATLPAGTYTLVLGVYNSVGGTTAFTKNLIGFIEDGGAEHLAATTVYSVNTWKYEFITFTLAEETTGKFSLGYQGSNVGSGSAQHLFLSGIQLFDGEVDVESYEAEKQAQREIKEARVLLQNEINAVKASEDAELLADAIAAAEQALANATTAAELQQALADLKAAEANVANLKALAANTEKVAGASATNPVLTDFVVNGTFTDNVNGWDCTGGFQNRNRASNQYGDFTVPFFENWNPSAKENKMSQTINNIPNGTYKLKIAAFVNTLADPNESQFVFANEDKVYLTTGEPTFYEVWTVLTNNTIEIGLEQTTATANWMGIDNVTLTYYGEGDVIEEAKVSDAAIQAQKEFDDAKEQLQKEIENARALDADVLAEAIAAAEAALESATTVAELQAALEALQAAEANVANLKELAENKEKLAGSSFENPSEDLLVNGSFDTANQGWTLSNMSYQQNQERPTRYVEKWNNGALSVNGYASQTIKNLPKGAYYLTGVVNAQLQSDQSLEITGATLSVNEEEIATSGAWRDYEIVYNLKEDGDITVKFAFNSTNANWVSCDDFKLIYGGEDFEKFISDKASLGPKKAYKDALAAAQAALANEAYANVTGEEKTALEELVAMDEPSSADAYTQVAAMIIEATKVFTEAAASYDALAAANAMNVVLPYADAAKKPEAQTANKAADAADAADDLLKALRPYYESNAMAEAVEGAVSFEDVIAEANADKNQGWTNGIGTNQGQGYTDSGKNYYDAKYLDGGWASNAGANIDMTRTVSVPAGRYLLTVKARGSVNLDTYTLSIAGKTIDLPHVSNTGGVFGNGWNDAFVEFVSDNGEDLTLEIIAKSEASQQWISINEFRLVQLEAGTTTAISEVSAAVASEGIYNLRGQRVEKAKKGLYIVNGKKMVVK